MAQGAGCRHERSRTLSGRWLLAFLNPRDPNENWIFRPAPGPIFAISACAEGQFKLLCSRSHTGVGFLRHSFGAFWEGCSDDGFSAEAEADFQGLSMSFAIVSESLADVPQPAAGSARYKISRQIDFTGPSAAEWTYHPRFPWIATTKCWALPEVGAGGPLNADPWPLALREFHLNGVSISPQGCERWVSEIRRDRSGFFSEQAEVKQFIDIDDAVGQPRVLQLGCVCVLLHPGLPFIVRHVLHRVLIGAGRGLFAT
jgi:hypothetical protein